RLAEEKIKQGILHADKQVREVAIRYFSRPTTRDSSIMPVAIQAVEKYGRRQAFSFNHRLSPGPPERKSDSGSGDRRRQNQPSGWRWQRLSHTGGKGNASKTFSHRSSFDKPAS